MGQAYKPSVAKPPTKAQERAWHAVYRAVKTGKLIRQPCQVAGCGVTRVAAHHTDYSRPLDVIWLCGRHHRIMDNLRRNAEAV